MHPFILVNEENAIHMSNWFSFICCCTSPRNLFVPIVNLMLRSLAVFTNQNIIIFYVIHGAANIEILKMLSNMWFFFVSKNRLVYKFSITWAQLWFNSTTTIYSSRFQEELYIIKLNKLIKAKGWKLLFNLKAEID